MISAGILGQNYPRLHTHSELGLKLYSKPDTESSMFKGMTILIYLFERGISTKSFNKDNSMVE